MSRPALTRRRVIVGGAVALTGAGTGIAVTASRSGPRTLAPLPPAVAGLPDTQHGWDPTLAADRYGNRLAPRLHRLLLFDLDGRPTVADAQRFEAALRRIERRWPFGPAGLLSTIGWGPEWFRAIDAEPPVPDPEPLASTEIPDLERFVAVAHLAGDRGTVLDAAERELRAATRTLVVAARRTGFTGRGLARRAAKRLELPGGVAPPADSPLLMGFESGKRRSQARESDVTIADGPWAGATTMHVSEIALTLPSWYRSLDEDGRAAQMFGPGISAADASRQRAGLTPPGLGVRESARRHGVVGHAQAAAKARRDGRPVILRRDFNGSRDGQPLTHFVSLQRDITDFVATRQAMNAEAAVGVNGVDTVVNNGINEWLSVRKRANFLVPPRSRRSHPGLAGWDAA